MVRFGCGGRGMAAAALSSGDFPGDFCFRFCTKEEGLEVLPAHREHGHSRISYCEADDRSGTIPIQTRCWLPVFHRLSATWGPCCAWWSDWIVHVHAWTWYWGTANHVGMVSENFMFHVWQVGVSISINWLQGISISMLSISLVKWALRHRAYNQTAEEVTRWFPVELVSDSFGIKGCRDKGSGYSNVIHSFPPLTLCSHAQQVLDASLNKRNLVFADGGMGWSCSRHRGGH